MIQLKRTKDKNTSKIAHKNSYAPYCGDISCG